MNLPLQQSDDQSLSLLQTRWKSIIDPLLSNPANNSLLITGVLLSTGDNVINHTLGKKLQGWVIVGNNAATTFYDKQSQNQQPQLTLVLNSSGACSVNILVF